MSINSTYTGKLESRADALTLILACTSNILHPVNPETIAKKDRLVVEHGAIFVIVKDESLRIRDDQFWSPSRRFTSGIRYYRQTSTRLYPENRGRCVRKKESKSRKCKQNKDYRIVGSLTDDVYEFKDGGLIKRTFQYTSADKISYFVVSYHSSDEDGFDDLTTPSTDTKFASLSKDVEQLLRTPVRSTQPRNTPHHPPSSSTTTSKKRPNNNDVPDSRKRKK
ncbi:hypothetical protein BC936DRAFT_144016 [Jimgerdemannia flammicorona]|uniref:Uncharacterized protein n=1 Tax=Jimgerdemannia flammicorona TaxID=994334 RepID=A0A432ZY58_9FUNG|nr:hypothetical protein BC936DRAFT_144016 [Jimgerdemannia flammicorona]